MRHPYQIIWWTYHWQSRKLVYHPKLFAMLKTFSFHSCSPDIQQVSRQTCRSNRRPRHSHDPRDSILRSRQVRDKIEFLAAHKTCWIIVLVEIFNSNLLIAFRNLDNVDWSCSSGVDNNSLISVLKQVLVFFDLFISLPCRSSKRDPCRKLPWSEMHHHHSALHF